MTNPEQKPSRLSIVKATFGQGDGRRGPSATSEQMEVSVDNLVEDPENERKTFDGMDDLIASVKVHGVVEPVTVTRLENGKYQIVTGHRRFRAAKAAGLKTIEVLIRKPDEKWERRKKSLVSNVQRADIRPLELAESLKLLLDNDPAIKTQEDLARAIGKPKSWVSDMLRIRALPADLKEKVRTSELSISADAVSKVARLENPKVQGELIDQLLAGGSVREIRQQINIHKGKAPVAKDPSPAPKPKFVFHTEYGADVIVQSRKSRLSPDERVGALQEALKQAKTERG